MSEVEGCGAVRAGALVVVVVSSMIVVLGFRAMVVSYESSGEYIYCGGRGYNLGVLTFARTKRALALEMQVSFSLCRDEACKRWSGRKRSIMLLEVRLSVH